MTSRLRLLRCLLLHPGPTPCADCWWRSEAASKARHPTWRFW